MVLERKTVNTADGPVDVEVVPSVRDLIRICEVILDRVVGKPMQEIDVTAGGERFHTIVNTIDANRERREALAKVKAAQEAKEGGENSANERSV